MEVEIRALTKNLREDYLHLFDNMVHKENPEWSKCYCNDYHFLGDVETCTRAMSRAMIIDRIEGEQLQGYLVYKDDQAIGWCNVNNRSNYQRLMRDYDLVDNQQDKVCSVVCFLIHPDYRRQGISQKILDKVIADCTNTDYDYLEAYPKKITASTSSFNGPFELYKKNGFTVYQEHESYYVVRKLMK